MKSHLETFKAALHLLSPVFIGAGRDITKKEFIFDPASNQVHIPDFHKLVNFLDKARLLDAYESFMQSTVGDLRTFLSQNRITPEQYPEFTVYNYAAGDALDQYHTLTGIQLFMQDGTGKPYIPGSSLKGALRTALLAEILSKESPQNHINTLQKMKASLAEKSFKRDLNRLSDEIEQKHFHRLALNERRPFDAVNSVLKGLQISDSAPLNHKDLILCKKIDVNKEGLTRSINTCRECLRPNTRVEFVITLDNAILSKAQITKAGILQAVKIFAELQARELGKFTPPPRADNTPTTAGCELTLGGGAGFSSKTCLTAMPQAEALDYTAALMTKQFPPNHKHNQDVSRGVSPHTVKYTSVGGTLYRFGRCALVFE